MYKNLQTPLSPEYNAIVQNNTNRFVKNNKTFSIDTHTHLSKIERSISQLFELHMFPYNKNQCSVCINNQYNYRSEVKDAL